MRLFTTASLLALSTILGATVAHNIQLKAHDRECFHENLHKDDKMTVTFQVGDREFGGAGNLDIDFWVSLDGFQFRSKQLRGRRYKIPSELLNSTKDLCLLEITLLQPTMTENIYTVSAMSTGQHRAKRSHSMCTG
jgi:hypothetical protein